MECKIISIFSPFQYSSREKMEMEMEVEDRQIAFLFPWWKPIRRRFRCDSSFFEAGNIERELLAKQIALDITEEEKQHIRDMETSESSDVCCPIAGCRTRVKSVEDFENHYNTRHMASCSTCSRVYPTSRLLSIHVSEAHDSFFQAKAARGYAMYECLVEGCEVKLKNYKSRQQHLVDKHRFPSAFEFCKKAKPSKKHRQKVQKKQLSKKDNSPTAMQVEDENINSLVSAVSRLSTADSPSSISFGRRHNRGLTFVPRAVRKARTDLSPGQTET